MAGEELCITKGAVSYQIRKLERGLGVLLFKRQVRQVLLTDAGQLLLQSTQRTFEDLSETIDRLGSGAADDVVIGATTYVAARWLSPRLAGFIASFPNISVRFQHHVNSIRFNLDEVDVAIRWGICEGRVGGERLQELPMPLFPVCSPELARTIKNASDTDLHNMTLLCEERAQDLWQDWDRELKVLTQCRRLVIEDANVRVQAAIDGQGLVLADELMQTEITSGQLVQPFDHHLHGYGYVLMASPSTRGSEVSSAIINWLFTASHQASSN